MVSLRVIMIIFANFIIVMNSESPKNNKDDPCESVGPSGRYWSSFVVTNRKKFDKGKKVPKFVITSWFERLGNHYIQIHRALRYAVCCRGRVRTVHITFRTVVAIISIICLSFLIHLARNKVSERKYAKIEEIFGFFS